MSLCHLSFHLFVVVLAGRQPMSLWRVAHGWEVGKAHHPKSLQVDNSRPPQSILHQGGRLFRGTTGLDLYRAEEESVGVCQVVSGSRWALHVDIPPIAIHSMTGGELTTGRGRMGEKRDRDRDHRVADVPSRGG